jgi:formate dehydrogenase subunit delta
MPVADQVRMANDIARQFAHLEADKAVGEIATHLHSFWDPRMCVQLQHAVDEGAEGLDPLVVAAVARGI